MEVGAEGIVGVELLIDVDSAIVQFFALTSAVKGGERKIVTAVINATPEEWFLAVPFDWSGGYWQRVVQDYPCLNIF